MRAPLKIQSSPKCKAREKFRSAAYDRYVSKKFFPQRSSWDTTKLLCRVTFRLAGTKIWIFRGAQV